MALLLHFQDSLNKILVMSMKVPRSQLVLSVLPYICLGFKISPQSIPSTLPEFIIDTVSFTSHLQNTQ